MTIPQIENEIKNALARIDALEKENSLLCENINELREQVGVERYPVCATEARPVGYSEQPTATNRR